MVKIVAVVPFTGSEELVAMTERCIEGLTDCGVDVVAINNAASRPLRTMPHVYEHFVTENLGFGKAVNLGIRMALLRNSEVTHVLVANNDLEFPDEDWLVHLIREIEHPKVLSPKTNRTANPSSRAKGPEDKPATKVAQVSAFCWLVPIDVIRAIHSRFGFHLFDPAFFAYGEDDLTGAILRHLFGPKPFKVVAKSWVDHLKGRTSKEVGVRAGDPKNLELIKARKKALGIR